MSKSDNYGKYLFARWWFDNASKWPLSFTPNEYDCIDAVIETKLGRCGIEIKFRPDYRSDDTRIIRDGVRFEKMKYDEYLQNGQRNWNIDNLLYLMIFSNHIGYLFNITRLACANVLNWVETMNPATTEFGRTEKVPKMTCDIPLSLAVKPTEEAVVKELDFKKYQDPNISKVKLD